MSELDDERAAHEEIAEICFACGVETDDGTSVSAVRNLAARLSRYETAMREALDTMTPLSNIPSILRAALSDQPAAPSDLEMKYRRLLWLSHFHLGLYGDDGEMQCTECAKFGSMDYKRDPLEKVEEAHHLALLTRTSIASRPPTDQPAEDPAESKLEAVRKLAEELGKPEPRIDLASDYLTGRHEGHYSALRFVGAKLLAILDAQPSTPEPKGKRK